MPKPGPDPATAQRLLRTARVVRVDEDACEVWTRDGLTSVGFAPMFPSPRLERVSPGHLVAIVPGPTGRDVVVWRWYDAVVLGQASDGSVRLWEPAHGEVTARARTSHLKQDPGSRAYASAGLPGADWWVAGSVDCAPQHADVDLDEVAALYAEHDLWPAVFGAATWQR